MPTRLELIQQAQAREDRELQARRQRAVDTFPQPPLINGRPINYNQLPPRLRAHTGPRGELEEQGRVG